MKKLLIPISFLAHLLFAQNFLLPSMQQTAPINYKYYNLGGDEYCSNGITLYPDSMAMLSGGCEGREHVSVGWWRLIEDSLEVIPSNETNRSLIQRISWSAQDTQDSTVFVVTDMTGSGVDRFTFFGICKNVDYQGNRSSVGDYSYIESMYYGVPHYMTFGSNIVKIRTSNIDSLVLPKLEVISGKRYVMSTSQLPDTIYIQLALFGSTVYYNELKRNEIGKSFKYKVVYKDAQKKEWDLKLEDE